MTHSPPTTDSTIQANGSSLADNLFHNMLERIQSGEWSPGTVLPGQRKLVEEFGVSGVPLREALSMLKSWGVLEVRQGRKSVIRRMDPDVLQSLLPLAFSLEDKRSFRQICELRLALEPKAAALATEHMGDTALAKLRELTQRMRETSEKGGEEFFNSDLAFHLHIAESTGNPLFLLVLRAISGIVIEVQSIGCGHDKKRREMAIWSHELIIDAIEHRDSRRASVEMEAHLRYTINHDPSQPPHEDEEPIDSTASSREN
jgi:DNA-binding FadR family transcriptional regulator